MQINLASATLVLALPGALTDNHYRLGFVGCLPEIVVVEGKDLSYLSLPITDNSIHHYLMLLLSFRLISPHAESVSVSLS